MGRGCSGVGVCVCVCGGARLNQVSCMCIKRQYSVCAYREQVDRCASGVTAGTQVAPSSKVVTAGTQTASLRVCVWMSLQHDCTTTRAADAVAHGAV